MSKGFSNLISSIVLSFLAITAHSNTDDNKAAAIIIDLNGSTCVIQHANCNPISKGQFIYNRSKLYVEGSVTIFDLDEKNWNKLPSGSYLITSSTNPVKEKQIVENKLSSLYTIQNRPTASISTRNDSDINTCTTEQFELCRVQISNQNIESLASLLNLESVSIPSYSKYQNLNESVSKNSALSGLIAKSCATVEGSTSAPNITDIVIESSGGSFKLSPLSSNCERAFLSEKASLDTAIKDHSSKNYMWALIALYQKYDLNFNAIKTLQQLKNSP
ncbi:MULTISPECIES: hypothetical protein [unclassified Oleiphilus]|uniref:hypothetical protein n=2 Tax=Oleiphilus TaxID=141450 RepID=UPI000ADA9C0A|nr:MULTISPECIES: hypothetical protein [unclassified Oleiphilus]